MSDVLFSQPHLLGIDGLLRQDIALVLDTARSLAEVNDRALKKVPALRGRTVALLFFENSTRTRLSFELAAKRLSADTLSMSSSGSSMAKGETLRDTARNLEAMGPDLVVVRHNQSGAAHLLSRTMSASIINAGDGQHEHPTQALLDAYTLLGHFGRSSAEGLTGKTVVIVGDIAHSRVARSNILCLSMLGARVRVAGPATMLPAGIDAMGCESTTRVDDALDGADAVMMLRIQKERMSAARMGSDRDYLQGYGLTRARFARLRPEAVVLHPGPINRGVEIDHDVADDPRSLILDQTKNGVAVRMAVLYLLALRHAKVEGA